MRSAWQQRNAIAIHLRYVMSIKTEATIEDLYRVPEAEPAVPGWLMPVDDLFFY